MADNNGSNNIVAIFAIIVIVLIAGFILYYAFGNREPVSAVPAVPDTTNIIEAPRTTTPDTGPTTPGNGGMTAPGNGVTAPGTGATDTSQ